MDSARTPKRKRRRRESSSTKRTNKKSSSLSSVANKNTGSVGNEAKIVWNDSPADKQIKVSGTGKMAVRREMQGFVGRLARASQQSPPSNSKDDIKLGRKRVCAREKTEPSDDEKASSCCPYPSEDVNQKAVTSTSKRSREKSDSQDELFHVLDQMEQKYASPDGLTKSKILPNRGQCADVNKSLQMGAAALMEDVCFTSVSSYSSTGTQEASTTQERPRHVEVVKALKAIQEQEGSKTQDLIAKKIVIDSDPFDDLTDESWALLDQLQSQRNHAEATCQQSQTDCEPFALTPRPVPSVVSLKPKHELPIIPEVSPFTLGVRSMHGEACDNYMRYLVLEVDRNVVNRSLVLRLLDNQEMQLEAILQDDWYELTVDAGDTINLIFTEQFKEKSEEGRQEQIWVDKAKNLVVVHPDILVSPTRVTTSFGCLRRAVVQETLAVAVVMNKKAFLGTLKHELFEFALLNGLDKTRGLYEAATQIVQTNILGLVECGINEEDAFFELERVIEDFRSWISAAMFGSGTLLNETTLNNVSKKIHVSRVISTEEMMWSIKWGLKGATDASIEGNIVSLGKRRSEETESVIFPLELKTGSKKFAALEHQGQVILYTLLLNERYRQRCQDGLLVYVPPIETNRISVNSSHVRGLVMARNNFASAMAKVKSFSGSASAQVYPPMIRKRRECERCFQVDECVLHHAATENGTEESSGLGDFFTLMTNHLKEADFNYFKHWTRLVDLEQQYAEKNLRALWLQVGWQREQALESSTCIANLKLVSDAPAPSKSGAKRILRFVRDRRRQDTKFDGKAARPTSFAGIHFRVDERVILSAESLDEKTLLVHVSRATVSKIEHGLITIESRQCIPSVVKLGQSAVGKEFTWRLDKDTILSGLRHARGNLVQLFIGTPPEAITAGTALDNRPELKMQMSALITSEVRENGDNSISGEGDTRRRNLIVHLACPYFKSCSVVDLITQRCQDIANCSSSEAPQGESLLDDFYTLNIDQQRAVQRVVSSLDYALVLGMPGTGKTATIAYTVRVLLFLGFSVLVTSYTHSAVDTLLLKLLAFHIPILRIGNKTQVHPRIADYTLDCQAERENISRVSAMEAKLVNSKLVGCTCLSVNSHVLFTKRRFDFCIVDEASQITQPIVLGPLRCADTFVLVGDHYQLPPLVANAQARKAGMDVSLFRRLAEAHPEATQQLSYQYRMNRDIMLLANRLVYGDKLKCGNDRVASNHLQLKWLCQETVAQTSVWPMQVLTNDKGVVFLNTDAMGQATEESSSNAQNGMSGRRRMENVGEAQVIAGLVASLVLGSISPEEIAVISPFRSQVAIIRQELAKIASVHQGGKADWIHAIEVSTIDKYQGKDKDVILVSFVRCNKEKHVGELLLDWRRINVAITRAKQKLILIGSLRTLSGGSALFYVLASVIEEHGWGYELPPDAVETLRHFAASVATPVEPDPEQGTTTPIPRSTEAVKISILRQDAASSDIEALVSNEASLSFRPSPRHHLSQMKPISRNILGEM